MSLPTIIIDFGHSVTSDPGAIGIGGIREADVNFAIGTRLVNRLKDYGFTVGVTHEKEGASFTERVRRALEQGGQYLYSIHCNASAPEAHGSEVYKSISDPTDIADMLLGSLVSLGFADRGVKTRVNTAGTDYYAILRESIAQGGGKMLPYIIECFFITSQHDIDIFDRVGPDGIADAIAAHVAEFYGVNVPPVTPIPPPLPPEITPPGFLYPLGTHVTVRPGMSWFRSAAQAERSVSPVLATPGNYIVTAVAPNGAVNVGRTPEQQLGWLYTPLYCDALLTSSFYRVGDIVKIGENVRWYVTAECARTRSGPSSPAIPDSYAVNIVHPTGIIAVGKTPALTLGWVNPLDIPV